MVSGGQVLTSLTKISQGDSLQSFACLWLSPAVASYPVTEGLQQEEPESEAVSQLLGGPNSNNQPLPRMVPHQAVSGNMTGA